MATHRGVLTYEDYAQLPNDGRRYEIHDGELSVTPSPGTPHQRTIGDLYMMLRHHVNETGRGEVFLAPLDVVLSNTTVVQPDLIYVDPTRQHVITERAIAGAPTLAIEIISPSTPRIDRVTKLQLYARYRVPYYWIIDPDPHSIEAYELESNDYRLVAIVRGTERVALPPFPDLAFAPESLWS